MEGRLGTEDGESNRLNASSQGNEWEVVSLTASAYAAAPPPPVAEVGRNRRDYSSEGREAEAYRSIFMSDHFAFPPNQHENLPLEPLSDPIKRAFSPEPAPIEEDTSGRGGEEEEAPPFRESLGGDAFSEEGVGQSVCLPVVVAAVVVPQEALSKPEKGAEFRGRGARRGAEWWRGRAARFYTHAKEVNTFWSVVIAAAVMGIVVLGRRWQQERWQAVQLKCQSRVVGGSVPGFRETAGLLHLPGSTVVADESRK